MEGALPASIAETSSNMLIREHFEVVWIVPSPISRSSFPIPSSQFRLRDTLWNLELHLSMDPAIRTDSIHLNVNLLDYLSETSCRRIKLQIEARESGRVLCTSTRKTFRLGDQQRTIDFTIAEFFSDVVFRSFADLTLSCTFYLGEVPEGPFKENCILTPEAHSSKNNNEGKDILISQLKDLYTNQEDCDFVIKVKDKEFKVHKAILSARSPVLSAMLGHDMAEKKSSSVDIVDCEPEVFQHFLLYLYTGHVEELSWDNATSLFELGDKYDLQHLRKECVQFMEGNMCIEAFCDAVLLAVHHNIEALVKCAEVFFLKNAESIMITPKWLMIMKENPVICNELCLKYVTSKREAKK